MHKRKYSNPIQIAILTLIVCHYRCQMSDGLSSTAQHRIRYAITENQPANMRIGKLDDDLLQSLETRKTELISLLRTNKDGGILFRLVDATPLFQLNEVTSELSSTASIDLEELCLSYCIDGSSRAQLNLFVNIFHGSRLVSVVNVEVTVIDVDDNAPTFPPAIPRPYVLQLKEVIYRMGQQVELPKAVDKDVQPEHAEIAYHLESHPEDREEALKVFRLLIRNDTRIMLVLQQDLDYEKVSIYKLYLIARPPRLEERDGKTYMNAPQPHFRDQLEIHVEVININDVEPVFTKPVYTIEVPENTEVGSTIYILEADDGEVNSTISYSLEYGQDKLIFDTFGVEPDGRTLLRHPLDYETRKKYSFAVRASDGEFGAVVTLDIAVSDVNDETPEYITRPTTLQVEENLPSHTSIGQLYITDRDSPQVNGEILCGEPSELQGKQPLLFFAETMGTKKNFISDTLGPLEKYIYHRFDLYSGMKFDRENGPPVHLSFLVCSDNQLSSDGIQNVSKQMLEKSALTSTLTVSLTIIDQNDNKPVFRTPNYEAVIQENAPIGTRVVQVHADDADNERYATPKYRLLQNSVFSSAFVIEPETGWIAVSAVIDRETQSVYHLTVFAVDGDYSGSTEYKKAGPNIYSSRNRYTATAQVQIKITDVNDNAPEFRGPRQFAVEENSEPHTWIGDLQYVDRDEGINYQAEFSLTGIQVEVTQDPLVPKSTEVQKWSADVPIRLDKNGSLYTLERLDRENQSYYCFEVAVKDNAPNNSLSSTDTICVRVLDLNDNPPKFTNIRGSTPDLTNNTVPERKQLQTIVNVSVSMHEVPGYCALIAEAEDADEGLNAQLRYAFKPLETESRSKEGQHDISDAFAMDAQSGRLMLTRTLDRRDIGTYTFLVSVEDGGQPLHSSKQLVSIMIEDVPARGPWLFAQQATATNTMSRATDDLAEAHGIFVVIGLAGLSALLAAILIGAILCMIKPCRQNKRQSSKGKLWNKGSPAIEHFGTKFSLQHGATYMDQGNSYEDFALHNIPDKGYMEPLNGTMYPTSLMLANGPAQPLEQMFLPSDEASSLEPSLSCGYAPLDHYINSHKSDELMLLNSPLMNRLSPVTHLAAYSAAQQVDPNWIVASVPRPIWTPMECRSPDFQTRCEECQSCIGRQTVLSLHGENIVSIVPTLLTSTVSSIFHTTNAIPPTCEAPTSATYRPLSIGNLPPANNFSHVVHSANTTNLVIKERNGCGEEQRSDSGRGASDEEFVNTNCSTIPGVSINIGKLRSSTLKTFQPADCSKTSCVTFPSLPRNNHPEISVNKYGKFG